MPMMIKKLIFYFTYIKMSLISEYGFYYNNYYYVSFSFAKDGKKLIVMFRYTSHFSEIMVITNRGDSYIGESIASTANENGDIKHVVSEFEMSAKPYFYINPELFASCRYYKYNSYKTESLLIAKQFNTDLLKKLPNITSLGTLTREIYIDMVKFVSNAVDSFSSFEELINRI